MDNFRKPINNYLKELQDFYKQKYKGNIDLHHKEAFTAQYEK